MALTAEEEKELQTLEAELSLQSPVNLAPPGNLTPEEETELAELELLDIDSVYLKPEVRQFIENTVHIRREF